MNGFLAILLKEASHIRRQPSTLFFTFIIPVFEMLIFGYAIDTSVENTPTVVFDACRTRESRELVEALVNSRSFRVVAEAFTHHEYEHAVISGQAKVAVAIPPDFSQKLLTQKEASVQVLIDGSDSQVATAALHSSILLGLNRSIARAKVYAEAQQAAVARDPAGRATLPIDIRPRLLYNPNLESAHFFVPGLIGIIMQVVTLFLTSLAVVREREAGTLEQLFVTPVGRVGLMLGKIVPYAVLGFVETLVVLTVMVFVFQVPIRGDLLLLMPLSILFLLTALGMGLLISTVARTQLEALQFAFMIMLPSFLLSGFVFPRESMPEPIYWLGYAIPVTYFLEILRGIILRAAEWNDLVPHIRGLAVCCVVLLTLSVTRFRKQLD
ncbi:MAG: transport permease protein [Planctomycetota bacterium]|nr:MAG: transport permease protein [Planctomycetota bacterium]